MAKLAIIDRYKPAKVIGFFEQKGIGYVKVEWSNLPGWKGEIQTGIFRVKDVKIKRLPSRIERFIIKLGRKLTKRYEK